jgi:UDP-N-acetylmuramate--alanine ligase
MINYGPYFLVGVGGSGMAPLAQLLRGRGHSVEGSDRSLDQMLNRAKFDFLRAQGVGLHAQDGSGVVSAAQIVVASGAVEDSVPDMVAAKRVGATIMRRPELLAQLFNAAAVGIGVAGTSGKSTVTAMIGWMLHQAGRGPTIMNGAVMKNFVRPDALFASALVGAGDAFVSEVDESDGSIALYRPRVAVLNNIALDHKSMDELRALFGGFVGKAETAVINLDNEESAALAEHARDAITYSIGGKPGRLLARNLAPAADGIGFDVTDTQSGESIAVRLKVPGAHNVSNALSAIGAALACGLSLAQASEALGSFAGIRRRLEVVGSAGGVTVIDDFAHNPDKISATLSTLHAFPGRLLIVFQPHGFGPLRLMKNELIDTFASQMGEADVLVMPQPVYYGGTTDRSVSSTNIIAGVVARGRNAEAFAERAQCGERVLALAKPGDRIVIMGARDDTLTGFAEGLLTRLR